ncbi:MAG: hypothetical protein DMG60_07800 [Acidobacteria bacterium]|nr:MAG: hypothetical protein DMG60_07800 [Acidobacteriota bacterium]
MADCKTEHSKATLPLISPLREMLIAFKAESTVLKPDQFILINSNLAPLDLHAMTRRTIGPKLKTKKLPWRGYYAGRRGLATYLANTDPLAAMGMLRHKNLNTTQEFYIKTIPAVTLSAMKQLSSNVRDNKGLSLTASSGSGS